MGRGESTLQLWHVRENCKNKTEQPADGWAGKHTAPFYTGWISAALAPPGKRVHCSQPCLPGHLPGSPYTGSRLPLSSEGIGWGLRSLC